VSVFVALFAPALVDVIWGLIIAPSNPPDSLLYIRLSCVMITSLFNFLVWASRPAFFKILFSRCRKRNGLLKRNNNGGAGVNDHDDDNDVGSQVTFIPIQEFTYVLITPTCFSVSLR
jgi:hypothetical protein